MARTPNLPEVRYDYIALAGGVDHETPTLSLKPGVVRRGLNFECGVNGGYSYIQGFERYASIWADLLPSSMRYRITTCTSIEGVSVGDLVQSVETMAGGVVLAIRGDNELVLTRETIFDEPLMPGDVLEYISPGSGGGPVIFGEVIADTSIAADPREDAEYLSIAAERRRPFITPVPGEGPILGIAFLPEPFPQLITWRKHEGSDTVGMYTSALSVWTEVYYPQEIQFTAGSAEIKVNSVVTGADSGATGKVLNRPAVVPTKGAWGNGDAEGTILLYEVTGEFIVGEDLEVDAVKVAEVASPINQIELAPGKVRFHGVVGNFFGESRLYFVGGNNSAYEWDGELLVPIHTGNTDDRPSTVAVHKNHLFLVFNDTSLQFSAIANPYRWESLEGAGEVAMPSTVTNLIPAPGDQTSGAMVITMRDDTAILYGSSSQDFSLSTFNTGTGVFPFTAQTMDDVYGFGDRGVISLTTSLRFGNFETNTLTYNLTRWLDQRRNLITATIINRDKSQYRVFFADGSGLYVTIVNGRLKGAFPVQYDRPVLCACEGLAPATGTTVNDYEWAMFFGSDDGYIYKMDSGTSFDGEPIAASMTMVYNSTSSPRTLKRYRKASVELTGRGYAEFSVSYDLAYRDPDVNQPVSTVETNDLRSAFWDDFTWDQFIWDARDTNPNEIYLNGTAENIALRFSVHSNMIQPFTINSVILHYSYRRGLR